MNSGEATFPARVTAALRRDAGTAWNLLRRAGPVFLLPPLATAALVVASAWTSWHSLFGEDLQEHVAPCVLALAAVLSVGLYLRDRRAFFGWMAWLTAALFCRELHFAGTNNGIYVVLLVLFGYLVRRADRMQPFLSSRPLVGLLAGAMWCYLLAKTFDRGYWRALIPAAEEFRVPLEESLETTGHLMVLAAVLLARRLAAGWAPPANDQCPMSNDQSPQRTHHVIWVIGHWLLLISAPIVAAVMLARGDDPAEPRPRRIPGELPFELSSLCPVGEEIGERLFLAGSDEHRTLALWTLDDAGRPRFLADLELKVPTGDGGFYELDDLEGLAFDGKDTYYAVTSHRRLETDRDEERLRSSGGTECALVSFQLQPTERRLNSFPRSPHSFPRSAWERPARRSASVKIVHARTLCRDLLPRIRSARVFESVNWRHSKSFRWRSLAKSWQIDIEGLAWLDGRLLLGFKNPVEKGRATILAFDPATKQVTPFARPALGGHGILSLHYDRDSDALLILSNDPLKGRCDECRLWIARREKMTNDQCPMSTSSAAVSQSIGHWSRVIGRSHRESRSQSLGGAWVFPSRPSLILQPGGRQKASGVVLAAGRLHICFDDPHHPVLHSRPWPP